MAGRGELPPINIHATGKVTPPHPAMVLMNRLELRGDIREVAKAKLLSLTGEVMSADEIAYYLSELSGKPFAEVQDLVAEMLVAIGGRKVS